MDNTCVRLNTGSSSGQLHAVFSSLSIRVDRFDAVPGFLHSRSVREDAYPPSELTMLARLVLCISRSREEREGLVRGDPASKPTPRFETYAGQTGQGWG